MQIVINLVINSYILCLPSQELSTELNEQESMFSGLVETSDDVAQKFPSKEATSLSKQADDLKMRFEVCVVQTSKVRPLYTVTHATFADGKCKRLINVLVNP